MVYNYRINKTRKDKKKKGQDWRPDLSCPYTKKGSSNIKEWKKDAWKRQLEKMYNKYGGKA